MYIIILSESCFVFAESEHARWSHNIGDVKAHNNIYGAQFRWSKTLEQISVKATSRFTVKSSHYVIYASSLTSLDHPVEVAMPPDNLTPPPNIYHWGVRLPPSWYGLEDPEKQKKNRFLSETSPFWILYYKANISLTFCTLANKRFHPPYHCVSVPS